MSNTLKISDFQQTLDSESMDDFAKAMFITSCCAQSDEGSGVNLLLDTEIDFRIKANIYQLCAMNQATIDIYVHISLV